MIRLLMALSILAALSTTAAADDSYEGYVCEVRLLGLETYDATPDSEGVGRMNFSIRPNADCTGTFTVLWLCSVDAPTGGDCITGRRFTRPEMRAMYAALTNAVGSGLRATATTPAGRTSVNVLHIKR